MNQDRAEEEIRRLFRELRQEDERLAPPFDRELDAAAASGLQASPSWRISRLPVAAGIALVLCGSLAFVLLRRPPMQPVPTAGVEPTAAAVEPQPRVVASPTPERHIQITKAERRLGAPSGLKPSVWEAKPAAARRAAPAQSQSPPILISVWRSPTEFLLKSPNDLLLHNAVPRLHSSPEVIRTVIFDEYN